MPDADVRQHDGSRFCDHNTEMFNEVMALQNENELKQYAAGRANAAESGLHDVRGGAQPLRARRRRPALEPPPLSQRASGP